MRPFLFAAVALLVTLTGANGALAADHPKLTDAETFALTIGTGNLSGSPAAVAERLGAYDVVVVDGQEVTRAEVRALRQRGAVVLGYVSVGTIERFRPWYNSAKRYRMELWNDWGEWYARVAAPGYRQLILTRVAPSMMRKGLDGLFLDNTDMVESHLDQRRGMRALVSGLSRVVRRDGGVLFTQNGAASIGPTLRYYDGWNREDVSATYNFDRSRYERQTANEVQTAQAEIRRFTRRGLFVSGTDYVPPDDSVQTEESRNAICQAGAAPFVADIDLKRVPGVPLRCR